MSIMRRRPASRAAFTLTEMLAVMFVLAVLLGFGGAMLMLSFRANHVAAGTLRKIVVDGQVADRFREDVALAESVLERHGPDVRGKNCLILEMADGSIVTYRVTDRNLTRARKTDQGEQTTLLVRADPGAAIDFEFEHAAPRLVTLRTTETRSRSVSQRMDFVAALGGDRR